MKFTIIVPAFNEEACLGPTLDSIQAASELLRARRGEDSYVIVVDNNSTDGTSAVARSKGATVVHEPVQSISRARNTGARHATGNVLVFVDADVMVPRTLLDAILIWTNPLFIALFRRWKPVWRGWYSDPVRMNR